MQVECGLSALLSLTGHANDRVATADQRFRTSFTARAFPTADPPGRNDLTDIRGLGIALWWSLQNQAAFA